MTAAELWKVCAAESFSNNGSTTATPTSAASAAIGSTCGPGTDCAQSRYAPAGSPAKYGVVASSGSTTRSAPAAAASAIAASTTSRFFAQSSLHAGSWAAATTTTGTRGSFPA